MTINPIYFEARWHDALKETPSQKTFLSSCVKIFTSPLRTLCTFLVLPAAYHFHTTKQAVEKAWNKVWKDQEASDEYRALRCQFNPIELTIQTPDGARISGIFYQNVRSAQKDIPTILYFLPQAGLAKGGVHQWMLKKALKENRDFYNVVFFDYRGCGKSQVAPQSPEITAKKLMIDGESVYQCVREQFGISEKNIHLYGWSLGGGISAQIMALHPEAGRYVNSRSFSSLDAVIASRFPSFLAPVFQAVARFFEWSLDTQSVWEKIKDRSLVVYHKEDRTIPISASLFSQVGLENRLELYLKDSIINPREQTTLNHHETPYHAYMNRERIGVRESILQFLLHKNAFYFFSSRKHLARYCIEKGRVKRMHYPGKV